MPRAGARAGATGDAGGAAGSGAAGAFNKAVKKQAPPPVTQIAQFYVQPSSGFCWTPPVVRRLFEVNSEPHTGARPSVRLCVGLTNPNGTEANAAGRTNLSS